jgi:hypothetical protein
MECSKELRESFTSLEETTGNLRKKITYDLELYRGKVSEIDVVIKQVLEIVSMTAFASSWQRKETQWLIERPVENETLVSNGDLVNMTEIVSSQREILKLLTERVSWIEAFSSTLKGTYDSLKQIYDDLDGFRIRAVGDESTQV